MDKALGIRRGGTGSEVVKVLERKKLSRGKAAEGEAVGKRRGEYPRASKKCEMLGRAEAGKERVYDEMARLGRAVTKLFAFGTKSRSVFSK